MATKEQALKARWSPEFHDYCEELFRHPAFQGGGTRKLADGTYAVAVYIDKPYPETLMTYVDKTSKQIEVQRGIFVPVAVFDTYSL